MKYLEKKERMNSKLSAGDIKEIRTLLELGFCNRNIATIYGVGKSTIQRIKAGDCWKHVEQGLDK
jgi:IS30 family transposase